MTGNRMTDWECKYLVIKRWEEEVAGACTYQSSASCTYYWKNKHLIKDFVSQYPNLKYYWHYSMEGQQIRNKMFNNTGLCGHSGPASDIINIYRRTFPTHYHSKDFPYNFNPNEVCQGCKFYLNEEYKGDGM